MQVRLAFAVMTQVEADVLLIDEVLAVGDVAFQQKCFDVFNRLRDEGRTILFVTHDMAAVRRFCHRAMLLEEGVIRALGDPREVAASYVDMNLDRDSGDPAAPGARTGDGSAELTEAWWENEAGERMSALRQGRPCSFKVRVRFHRRVEDPAIAVVFENEALHPLMATSTDWAGYRTGEFERGDEAIFAVSFDMAFAPGRVYASPWVVHRGGHRLMDRVAQLSTVVITGSHRSGGLVDLPHDVRLDSGERVVAGSARP